MGRRSRHSAKTGDQSMYKSRAAAAAASSKREDDSDDDPMYDAVDRHHHRREEEYLQLDESDADEGDISEEDDGLTKKREGVFDLGAGGSSDDDDDEGESDEEQEEDKERRAKRQRETAAQSALASSSDEDSDSDDDEKGRLLNWGDKKHAYYHGDTADLEIGQDVADAYLEEEAGREVEKARLEEVEEADFLLDDDNDEGAPPAEDEPTKKTSKRKKGEGVETLRSAKSSRQLSQLSKKEKVQWLEANHPELLPLVRHFAGHARELGDETMVAAGALLRHGVVRGGREAEAVGATPAGLRYLLTKSMLQASAALNLALYLLLKADRASSYAAPLASGTSFLGDEDEADDIRDHPVMARLDQLSRLADGLREGVEDATPGLRGQMASLVKAAALMDGGALSSSDDDEEDDGEEGDGDEDTNSEEFCDEEQAANVLGNADDVDSNEDASSSSDSEEETEEAAKRRVMTEARFALRAQDVDRDRAETSKKRRRRLAPMASDYGDETEDVTEEAMAAGRKLASTMNSIVQKSSTSRDKKKRSVGDEEGEGDEYDDLHRGLKMMEEEFGQDSDAADSADQDGEEGIGDSDGDDEFYRTVQSKSRAKKAAKQSLYAVRPKYPRLDAEVEGERAIGRTILKNRGLVAHKAKINRNPRVKKREQYRKALIRRKGAVREVRTEEGHAYGGEATGIKSGISRSRKLGSR